VNKSNGNVLFKSLLDIHSYKTNPCNILQINWRHEFDNIDYKTNDDEYKNQIKKLLGCVQTSIKQDIQSKIDFANAVFN